MKKLIAIFILLAAAGGGSWWYYNYGKPKEKPQVMTTPVSRANIVEVVQATGTLEAQRLVQVGSQVSGTVKELYADFNSIVKKDMKIAELDSSLLETQVAIQKANIERQLGDIAQSRVQLENDRKNLARTEEQFAKGLVSQQQLETSQLQVKSREASIASSEKAMLQSQANLQQAELNVKYCTIVSPVDGVVVNRLVDKGQTVQSSVNVAQFFTIATDLTTMKLTAGVDEAEIGKVRRGMPVTFTVDSYGSQPFSGTVEAVRLNATSNQNVVTYPVWINVPNADLKLKPSMTASIQIIISTAEDALRVPNAALRFKPNTDIYTGLGLEPPQMNAGRVGANGRTGGDANGRGQGGQGANAQQGQPGQAPAAGATPTTGTAPATGQTPAAEPPQQVAQADQQGGGRGGRGGRGGGGNGSSRRGFGQSGNMNLTPEQLAAMGAGGRGNRNQQSANASGDTTPLTQRRTADGQLAEKIDDLFQPPPRVTQRGTVYTWDEAKKELKAISVTTGISDGTFSELVSSNPALQPGQALVTSVILPASQRTTSSPSMQNQQNPFLGNQRGGPGGGGGGGGRGGGGGGGRGGN